MGFRTQEEEGALDGMSLDEFLIENREATFMLRARSDSMRDAGILSGDIVLVDKSKQARPGDIVIAVRDGSFEMKYLNAGEETQVEAVVTAVIRKYL
jgi:DNA polymerase V